MGVGIFNAVETTAKEFIFHHGPALGESEEICLVYRTIRDYIAFTEKRILYVDTKGITGRKKQYLSIPYRAINAFSVETAGTLDLNSEAVIYISGRNPIKFKFARKENIAKLHELLTDFVNM